MGVYNLQTFETNFTPTWQLIICPMHESPHLNSSACDISSCNIEPMLYGLIFIYGPLCYALNISQIGHSISFSGQWQR